MLRGKYALASSFAKESFIRLSKPSCQTPTETAVYVSMTVHHVRYIRAHITLSTLSPLCYLSRRNAKICENVSDVTEMDSKHKAWLHAFIRRRADAVSTYVSPLQATGLVQSGSIEYKVLLVNRSGTRRPQ
jgi:hypothetical protein